jgi:hypothetical protein
MKIVLVNLPCHIPTVMPYSLTMMKCVLSSNLDEEIVCLDLNSKFHYLEFKEYYERKNRGENFFDLLEEFVNKTRELYPSISKNAILGKTPLHHDKILKDIISQNPDVVAFSLTYNSQIFFANGIIEELEKNNIKVIIGGPADNSKLPIKAKRLNNYELFLDFLIKNGAKKRKEILDAVLDFSDYVPKHYFTKDLIYPLRTAHSCPYKLCTFCTHHGNKKYSTISLEFIKKSIVKNKIKKICFIDDAFTSIRLEEMSRALKDLNIEFWCQLRPTIDFVSILPQLYNSGLRSVAWGVESGNQRILDFMKKGTKVMDVVKVLETAKTVGIKNQIYIMFGFPTETIEEFNETINFLEDNNENIDLISAAVFGLQKESRIYNDPKKYEIGTIITKKRTLLGDKIGFSVNEGINKEKIMKLKRKNMHLIHSINKVPKVINSCKEQILNYS